jgi:hypothetical protein
MIKNFVFFLEKLVEKTFLDQIYKFCLAGAQVLRCAELIKVRKNSSILSYKVSRIGKKTKNLLKRRNRRKFFFFLF